MSEIPSIEDVQKLISRGPYHQWLGLNVTAVGEGTIEMTATWREEWVVNPDRGYTHGGILAALVDLTADWAMVSKTGRGVPTVDLRAASQWFCATASGHVPSLLCAMSLLSGMCWRGPIEAHCLSHGMAAIGDAAPDQQSDGAVGYDGRHENIVPI